MTEIHSYGQVLIQIKKKKSWDQIHFGTISSGLFLVILGTFIFEMNFTHALQKSITKENQ